MLIECTFCKTKAKIPDSKEGAKVKCGNCGKVYVAREPGAKGNARPSKSSNTPFVIGGAVVVGVVVVAILANSGDKPAPPPVVAEKPKVEAPKVDLSGYESSFCKLARDVYDAAYIGNAARLESMIHFPKLVEYRRTLPDGESLPTWDEMTALQKDDLKTATIEGLMKGDGDEVVAKWRPFNGKVTLEEPANAEVRLEIAGREGDLQLENRNYDWKMALDKDGRWKVYAWTRYISAEEKKAAKVSVNKEITRVEVDGLSIKQADPRPLPHLDDTPPDVRKRIDELVEKVLDTNLRAKERTKVTADLVDLGKPALPILLTKMYEIQITDDKSLGQITIVHNLLKDITGKQVGFSPLGSGPESDKKRDIAIRQWFAWYLLSGERFENDKKKVGADALEGLVQPTERDKRAMEKDKAKGGG